MRYINLCVVFTGLFILACAYPGNEGYLDDNHIMFIGNSYQDEGIDFDRISKELHVSVDQTWKGGVQTAWKYTTLRRKILNDSVPHYVFFTTYHNILTLPA